MRNGKFLFSGALLLMASHSFSGQNCPSVLNHEIPKLGSSQALNLCKAYRGQVLLVVNTASECAFTSQYEGLEKLYREKKDEGLVVLGFPSNDFGGQEPGSEQKISSFCRINYGVSFPMFSKIRVKGEQAHPLFKELADASGSKPRWNFHKYLIGRDGEVIDSFYSFTGPNSSGLRKAIDRALW
jgi:glutathione peroxidase